MSKQLYRDGAWYRLVPEEEYGAMADAPARAARAEAALAKLQRAVRKGAGPWINLVRLMEE